MFPLHTLLFPHTDLGLHVFEHRYQSLVADCLDNGGGFGVVLIRRGREVTGPADPHVTGTLAHIGGYARLPDGRYLLEVEGMKRFRIQSMNGSTPYPQADVTWLPEPIGDFGRARSDGELVEELLTTHRQRCGDGDIPVPLPVDPVARSYVVANLLPVDPPEKQSLLDTESADVRLAREVAILRREMALLDHLAAGRS
ncbi:MAG TPA: LON peptidase substrate-binding domain-containing protein [Actinomycetota bacterium]|nr:LON peptidase substrate-binding domain-containing protein [Actinomycetota bacterium]